MNGPSKRNDIKINVDHTKLVIQYKLCPKCFLLFAAPKSLHLFTLSENNLIDYINQKIKENVEEKELIHLNSTKFCPCCLGGMADDTLEIRAKMIVDNLVKKSLTNKTVALVLQIAPAFDINRIACRTLILLTSEKNISFPNFNELYPKIIEAHIQKLLPSLKFVDVSKADVKIELTAQHGILPGESTAFCSQIYPDFKPKKRRFQLGQVVTEDLFEVSRKDVDKVIIFLRSLDIKVLESRMTIYSDFNSKSQINWVESIIIQPIYILGRYRKLARDVPQAPWNITSQGTNPDKIHPDGVDTATDRQLIEFKTSLVDGSQLKDEHDDDDDDDDEHDDDGNQRKKNDSNKNTEHHLKDCVDNTCTSTSSIVYERCSITVDKERKGRNSVEEIVADAVCKFFGAKYCRMHPCGREDMDVRVLGNGRPFALEVIEAKDVLTNELLSQVVDYVNTNNGLNECHDIELSYLELAQRSTWEGMQTAAEEKDKAYKCVVYSSRVINKQDLEDLKSRSYPELSILQKTPLRVLHRRSLLTRKRSIYRIETTFLNSHYFILSLVTSAGTYVKEFVHGDMGRTLPSVSSILQCNCDILQLDVTWLYDDYREGGRPTNSSLQGLLPPSV